MQQKIIRTVRIMKLVFICLAILLILWSFSFTAAFPAGKQHFNLTSSAVISLGFGVALCLTIYDRKKR